DKVTAYFIEPGVNRDIVNGGGIVPIVDYPINSMLLYSFRGLDKEGDPLGWVDGQLTKEYGDIINGSDRQSIELLGSKVPTLFGSLRHRIAYKRIELSFNILYKFGYYTKISNSFNSNSLIGGAFQFSDYPDRWQTIGDEENTNVPKFTYPLKINRDDFYQSSSALAVEGGHIRLQDIRLSYTWNPLGDFYKSDIQLYVYASNLGLIWKKNNQDLDPNNLVGFKVPVELSFGATFNF